MQTWTRCEEQRLIDLVDRHEFDWITIANYMQGRNSNTLHHKFDRMIKQKKVPHHLASTFLSNAQIRKAAKMARAGRVALHVCPSNIPSNMPSSSIQSCIRDCIATDAVTDAVIDAATDAATDANLEIASNPPSNTLPTTLSPTHACNYADACDYVDVPAYTLSFCTLHPATSFEPHPWAKLLDDACFLTCPSSYILIPVSLLEENA